MPASQTNSLVSFDRKPVNILESPFMQIQFQVTLTSRHTKHNVSYMFNIGSDSANVPGQRSTAVSKQLPFGQLH